MFKKLLLNEDQFEILRDSYENVNYSNRREIIRWSLGKPEKYPCVCVYEKRYNSNGPDYYDGEYVYVEDFEGKCFLMDNLEGLL